MKNILYRIVLCAMLIAPAIASAQMTTFRHSYNAGLFDISGGMVQTPNQEFVVAGLNNSVGPYYGNAFRLDASGTVVWGYRYNAGLATSFSDIKNVSTGGFILAGQTTSGGGGALLLRIDDLGNVVWSFNYQLPNIPSGNASSEWASSVIETSDGGFLVGGGVDYFWDGSSASTVDTTSAMGFKVNSAGTLIWNKVWTITVANPDEHYINDVTETADGYFFLGQSSEGSGTLSSNGDYPSNSLVIKTDKAAGTLTYIRRWGAGNTTSQGISAAITLSNGDILVSGFDDIHCFLLRLSGVGSGTPTVVFNRRISTSGTNIYMITDIAENSDGNYSVIGTWINIVIFPPAQNYYTVLGKINSTTTNWIFGRGYQAINGFGAILPEGGLCSDQGYYVTYTDQQFSGFNYNVIRTNTVGQTNDPAAGCAGVAWNPGLNTITVTWSTPAFNQYSLMTSSAAALVKTSLVPTRVQHCLNVAAPLSANSSQTNVTCFGACNGTATATPTGGTAPYTYAWAPSGGNAATATGLCPNTYTCTITDNVGATTTVTVNITQPAAALTGTITASSNTTCSSNCNGSATIAASGGTSGYTYSWAPAGGTGTTASGLCAAVYTVTITDANACTTTQTVSITSPTAVTATATSTPSSCSGNTGSATVTPSGGTGGYTYSWAPSGGTGVTASNLAPGPYTVTVTDANGCTGTANVTVSTTSGPTASLQSSTDVLCFGASTGTASVSVSGGNPGYTYSWAPSGGTAANATNLAAGNYTCTITDQSGCVTTQTVAITSPPQLTATTSTSASGCTNSGSATATPSGGAGSYTYSWSSGGTSQTESPLGPGTYTCIITDNNSCTTSATATVGLGASITVGASATSSTICAGTTTTITATGATTYNWQPGNLSGSSVVVNPSSSTTYTIIGTDGQNCADTTTFLVTVNPTPTVSVNSQPASICQGDSVTIGAGGASSYLWLPGNQTSQVIVDFPSSTTTYTLIGTDASGCSDTTTVTVTVNSTPVITASASTDTSCANAPVTLTGSGATNYNWMPGNLSGTSVTVNPSTSTTYTVIGSNGVCADTTTLGITVTPGPTVSVASSNDTICSGNSSTLTASGAVSYVWSSGGTNASETVTPTSSQTYTVTGTDANGCSSTATFSVTVNPLPTVTISGTNTICTGGSSTLTAAGASTYVWSTTATTNSISVSPTSSQTYSVVGTDANGCSSSTTYSVTVVAPPVAGVSGDTMICAGAGVTLTATGGGTYVWSTGATTSSISPAPTSTTTYSVYVSNGSCADTASITVNVNFGPAANAGIDDSVALGNSITLNGTGGGTYSWSPSSGLSNPNIADPMATPTVSTCYILTVTDSNSCSANDTVCITVYLDCGEIFIPNIFSPNGDDHNDSLKVYGSMCMEEFHWAIFDRWGELVFESTNPADAWDGTYKDKMLDPAVFAYKLIYREIGQTEEKELHGNVTLVK